MKPTLPDRLLDPAAIDVADSSGLIGELELLKAKLYARLVAPIVAHAGASTEPDQLLTAARVVHKNDQQSLPESLQNKAPKRTATLAFARAAALPLQG